MPTYPIWSTLDSEAVNEIFVCAQQTQKKLYRSTLDVLAKSMGMRPNRVLELPKVERHAAWAKIISHPHWEPISFNFLCHWLIETKADLLAAWLDALGIAHNGKGVTDAFPAAPTKEALRKAVDQVLARFDARSLSIYLRAFNEIDGVHWKTLDELLAEDARLQLTPRAASAPASTAVR